MVITVTKNHDGTFNVTSMNEDSCIKNVLLWHSDEKSAWMLAMVMESTAAFWMLATGRVGELQAAVHAFLKDEVDTPP